MDFDAFVAPRGAAAFLAEDFGRAPVHFPAAAARSVRFDWARMNDLLAIAPHWTPGNLKLILNSQPIAPVHYIETVQTFDGPVERADPAKIALFLRMGASLVANAVEGIAPEIRAIVDMLAARFVALTSANIYCSFDGIQAFATHYDSHEVFALQCAGEKVWRIYRNRADAPLDDDGMTQGEIDAARGGLAMEVRMRPGDLLYLPRGMYHDAIAQSGASLHVTFSVTPRSGRTLMPLIEAAMLRDPAFRAYLPSPDADGGAALTAHLDGLATRIAALVRTSGFALEVADAQRRLAVPAHRTTLPDRAPLQTYARTERPVRLDRDTQGTTLVAGGRRYPLGGTYAAAEWALSRPGFSATELDARFPHVSAASRRDLIALLEREQLIMRYTPGL